MHARCGLETKYLSKQWFDAIKACVDEAKKLGNDFGKAMPGFFTDEPQYYRTATPYSKYMDKWFKEEYGYSVFDALPAIFMEFEGCESYLYDFHKMTHTKYIN